MAITSMISVVVPLYNHEKFIREAIDSVLLQPVDNLEIIVVDDGSTDGSVDVVRSMGDSRIKLYQQKNTGAHAAINRGIQLARGSFVSILNSDDVYCDNRLKKCLDYLENTPEVDGLFTKVEAIDSHGEHLYFFPSKLPDIKGEFRSHPDQLTALDFLGSNPTITTSNLFCRREVFEEIGFFRNYRYCHDLDWLLRLVTRRHGRLLHSSLLKYRFHHTNTIKENSEKVFFEIGLILAGFFIEQNSLGSIFGKLDVSDTLMELNKSLRFRSVDKMMALLLATVREPSMWEEMRMSLLTDHAHPFREQCLREIKRLAGDDIVNHNLQQENKQLREEVAALQQENKLYRASILRRIGRILT